MRLNRRYEAAGGRTVPHVDGVALPAFVGRQAGSQVGCWYGDQPLNQAFVDGAWKLVRASGEVVSEQGQNHVFGGAGLWAAELNGYRDSRGKVEPGWSPVAADDISDRVAVAVHADNSLQVWDGAVLLMVEPTGPDRWEEGDICYRDGLLAYRKNGQIKTWPDQKPVAFVPASGVCYSRGYVCEYQSGRGVIVRDATSTRGLVLSSDDKDFGLDMRCKDDGTLIVVSSAGPAELPGEFRRYDVNPVLGTVNGERRDWVDLSSQPIVVPTFPDAPIAVIPFDYPGVPNVQDVFEWGTFKRVASQNNDPIPILARARATGKLSLGYYDDQPFDLNGVIPAFDYVGINAYPFKSRAGDLLPVDQSVSAARAEVRDCLERKRPRPCVLFCAVYTGSGAWPLQHVLDLLRGLWDVATEFRVPLLPFGIIREPRYQELTETLTRMLAAAKGQLPKLQPSPSKPAQPSGLSGDLLMSALTLKRSKFADGSYAADRGFKVYPLGNGNNLSIDIATGEPRPNGLPNNGPSESFLVKGDRAFVDFDGFGYSFLVVD